MTYFLTPAAALPPHARPVRLSAVSATRTPVRRRYPFAGGSRKMAGSRQQAAGRRKTAFGRRGEAAGSELQAADCRRHMRPGPPLAVAGTVSGCAALCRRRRLRLGRGGAREGGGGAGACCSACGPAHSAPGLPGPSPTLPLSRAPRRQGSGPEACRSWSLASLKRVPSAWFKLSRSFEMQS